MCKKICTLIYFPFFLCNSDHIHNIHWSTKIYPLYSKEKVHYNEWSHYCQDCWVKNLKVFHFCWNLKRFCAIMTLWLKIPHWQIWEISIQTSKLHEDKNVLRRVVPARIWSCWRIPIPNVKIPNCKIPNGKIQKVKNSKIEKLQKSKIQKIKKLIKNLIYKKLCIFQKFKILNFFRNFQYLKIFHIFQNFGNFRISRFFLVSHFF